LPERTDNDIKNYWNTHLKKKLTRAQDGTDRTSIHHSSFSKGQWERRLQTDIHTAKQALHDALALDEQKPPPNEDLHSHFLKPNPASSPSTCNVVYASSTENISKLLQGWMRSSPNKPRAHQSDSGSSQDYIRCESVSCRDECKSLSWLENWLFEDGAAGQDEMPNLESLQLPLDDHTEFFSE
jgi:transcription factor MYB, plant